MDESGRAVKERIRAVIRDRRMNLSDEVLAGCGSELSSYLEEFIRDELGRGLGDITVASYMPFRGEISTKAFCSKVLSAGGVILMPRVEGKDMIFHKVSSLDEGFETGSYGIMEPLAELPVFDIRNADVVIVPGIAYNDEGIRLGQGGGYYDRLYEYLGGDSPDRKVLMIGVCYDFQMVSSIPVDDRDMAVDVLIDVSSESQEV
ncbi:MAG: 5-formyltetrahydrofolate cyclo-ligase [Saccharofermentans sp.]|nr:5-formyltetrahydrofolate cyclo-ligase [Saccharofermentans sp.]